MKIVSLLPSATEIVFALGLGDSLEGRSFECDFPTAAERVAIVSGTTLPVDEHLTAREIDEAVATRVAAGESIYTLDAERIRAIQPDVILAQDLCEVCAVPSGAVTAALDVLGCDAEVVSLDPASLDDVIACVGQAESVLSPPGARSRRMEWSEVAGTAPAIVLFMPCGYYLDGAVEEGAALREHPALAAAEEIWALDANAYFSRPGPRVVDGVELLASVLHPDAFTPRAGATRLR